MRRLLPPAPYLFVRAISLELIWIPESLLHMTRTAVAPLHQMRDAHCHHENTWQFASVLTPQPGRSARPTFPRCASLRLSFIHPFTARTQEGEKSENNCLKVTLAWHVRDVPANAEMEKPWKRSRTEKDEPLSTSISSCRHETRHNHAKRKKTYSFRERWHHWSTLRARFGDFHDFNLLGCHRSEKCK